METGESMDAHLCAIEIFRDVNQCVRNAEEPSVLVSKCFQGVANILCAVHG